MELIQKLQITHVYGLHARASTKFVEIAQQFHSEVAVSRDSVNEVDGKSVLGILTLGAELDHEIVLRVNGPDAQECLDALVSLVQRDFDGV